MTENKVIASTNQNTVVAEYKSEPSNRAEYQSESELEKDFINILQNQCYEYIAIKNEDELIKNLRLQLEKLNNYKFSDSEWNRLFKNDISNPTLHIVEKTENIQKDNRKNLRLDNGKTKNIELIDKENIHNNSLQIINQYEAEGKYKNRYDVTILVNGLPLVHIELKRRGISIREAFNQIERYQRESFWTGSGLYEYVQIFVISNGTYTKYYSNTTRNAHIDELNKNNKSNVNKKTSNSFEFTSYWADAKNKTIRDLIDFTKTFLSKHTLLNMLTKYCVFTEEKLLLVMRPYQIVATEKIIHKIKMANNNKTIGSVDAGGYIWHTTGSGKTLTSFKTAQLVSSMCDLSVDKVLFVVDRKDLDYQTMKEYDSYKKDCANSNTSTAELKKQLEDDSSIIITTIQKLGHFVNANKNHDVYQKHIVMIFDECHRSQFGEFHRKITKAFKKYHLFGFTGTPIFIENIGVSRKTTEQIFGNELHAYTIIDAIKDENVLPFRIDYIRTMKEKDNIEDTKILNIDEEKILLKPERISNVTKYILEHYDIKTKRNKSYNFFTTTNINEMAKSKYNKINAIKNQSSVSGFNSIFAVSSIKFAKVYYDEFKRQNTNLKIATIFSFGINESEEDTTIYDENPDDTSQLDKPSKEFLESAIKDYNQMFNTNYDTSSEKFGNYYKDVSLRMKNRELDLLIVVNMFLTGFDATTLNTLWVDKNLRYHGLIQAFSRTNRILNSVKKYGNIICFRNLQKNTDEAIARFGDKDKNASEIVLLKDYESYYYGYDDNDKKHHLGYKEIVDKIIESFPLGKEIIGENAEKEFISTFGSLLKIINILKSFDQFQSIDQHLMGDDDIQDYQSVYIDLYEKYKHKEHNEKIDISDEVEFEMELIRSVEINIDYILMLIEKNKSKSKKILKNILRRPINSNIELRNKDELIKAFIDNINTETNIIDEWQKFIIKKSKEDLCKIIKTEKLQEKETFKFINNAFRIGYIKTIGTDMDNILPPIPIFSKTKNRAQIKQKVTKKLQRYFEIYYGMVSNIVE